MVSLFTLLQLDTFCISILQIIHNYLLELGSNYYNKDIRMKILNKIVLGLLILASTLSADVTNIVVTPKFIKDTKLKIIDIRTEGEWRETGIVQGAYTITFFDERGNYDIDGFLAQLDRVVAKGEKFALICRTGSRTGMVSNFLGNKLNYNVVNLKGGMMKLLREGFNPEFYTPKKK